MLDHSLSHSSSHPQDASPPQFFLLLFPFPPLPRSLLTLHKIRTKCSRLPLSLSIEELIIDRIGRLGKIDVSPLRQVLQPFVEFFLLSRLHLQTYQHPANVPALVTVMKEADVPPFAQVGQERMQGTRPLGKLEAKELLVFDMGSAATGQVAGVGLGHLVGAQVDHLKFCLWIDVYKS